MYSIILSMALASASQAPAQNTYGSYGTYGGHGSYAGSPSTRSGVNVGYYHPLNYGPYYPIWPWSMEGCTPGSSKKSETEVKVEKFLVTIEEKYKVLTDKVMGLEETIKNVQAAPLPGGSPADMKFLEKRFFDFEMGIVGRQEQFERKWDSKFDQLLDQIRSLGQKFEDKGKPSVEKIIDKIQIEKHDHFIKGGATKKISINGRPFNRALVMISLPADAKLFIDDQPTTLTSNLRTFYTPVLDVSKNYYYNLRIEVEREGKVLTNTQKIYFQAGREIRVNFEMRDNFSPLPPSNNVPPMAPPVGGPPVPPLGGNSLVPPGGPPIGGPDIPQIPASQNNGLAPPDGPIPERNFPVIPNK